MSVSVLSSVYGTAATWRRRWYSSPARVNRLRRPVVSVGNLSVGGSGKTPVVAHLAQILLALGQRPGILTRGYARTRPALGVTVVSDGVRLLADVAAAGDEPFMLARALPGVPVLVGADRFASGSLAERELGVTVHVLDDGFQHVQLARDVDLLMVDDRDLDDCVLPTGRLREPLANAAQADAALVTTENPVHARNVAETLGIEASFTVTRQVHAARALSGADLAGRKDGPVVAFAGIARPERFFADLASAGWHVAETMPFADHHPFSQSDVDQLAEYAKAAGTSMLVTTEKDAVRLQGIDIHGLTIAYIPLTATIEPAEGFRAWLIDRLSQR